MQTARRHIKAQCGDEIRRFVLEEASYASLKAALWGIFEISQESNLMLRWMDDEGDWVLKAFYHHNFLRLPYPLTMN